MKQTHLFHTYMCKRENLRCRENRQVSARFLTFSTIAILDLIILCCCWCVCVCAVLCTKGWLAVSGFYPQGAHGNLSPLVPANCEKCFTTLPNVPWDAKLSPAENHQVSTFVITCSVTDYPPNLVA